MKDELSIQPNPITLKEGESVQLEVVGVNGEPVGDIRWQELDGGGIIDQYGVLTAIRAGGWTIKAYVPDKENPGEICLRGYYNVIAVPSINKQFEERQMEIPKIPDLKPLPGESKNTSEQAKEKGKTFMAHTRAIVRTLGANKDLTCLVALILFAVIFGGCLVLLLSGFTVEKIGAFLAMLFGLIVSFFGKLYAPQGEVSEAIEIKVAGATDDEKIRFLTEKRNRIESKIQELKTNKRDSGSFKQASFYKMTLDENSHF